MRNTRRLVAVGICVATLGSCCLMAEDWPQWRGPNRNAHVTGFEAPQTWPKTLTEKWRVVVGAGDSTPALVGDRLYVFARQGDSEVTSCLEAATGKEIWRDSLAVPAIAGPSARAHAGPRSSPAVADGKVVILGVTGILSCLDAASGKLVWRNTDYKEVPRFYTASSPIIVDGMCIAQLGGSSNGGIMAFDLNTGAQKWKWTGAGPGYSSPVMMSVDGMKQLVALTDKDIVGINAADGKELWKLAFAPQGMAYNAATPIVEGQTVIVTGQGRGTKAISLEKQGDAFTTKELWSNPQVATQFSNPVLKDSMLYAISDKGALVCIDAKTGETVWTDAVKRGNYGAMLDAGSVIMVLPEKGDLVVFKPGEKQFAELASIKVAKSNTYAYPVISGKAMYVKDQDAVAMLTFE